MKPREFKDAVFGEFARIGQAFSSSKRLEIVDVLAQGERSVEVLSRETGQTVANASRHLQILKNAKLVETRKDGVRVYYRLADPQILLCWQSLQRLAESRLAEVDLAVQSYIDSRDGIEPMSHEDLLRRAERGEIVVLDVRPAEEYEAGHIAGAASIPLSELRTRLGEIAEDREVVAYCRGPYCVLAVEAVAMLRKFGRKAVRLEAGLPEWRQRGLPVEKGH